MPKTWPFIGLTRLEQTFHWLISVSSDFRSPKASFPIHLLSLLLFTHLHKGSLVPPMCTHGGSSFPRIITLFTQGRRVFRSPGCPGSLFLVPDPRFSYRILVPRTSFLVPRSSYLVPRTSFLVPRSSYLVPRTSFLVPRSSYLVPDVTYRFITPSPPSEKEASLNPGIIYTLGARGGEPLPRRPALCHRPVIPADVVFGSRP